MKINAFIASAALIGLSAIAFQSALADETVVTKTIVSPQNVPDINKINFIAFDINHDGILTMQEVGEKLFDLFDQDGNGEIDNIEFTRKTVMTIIPMEKDTLKLVDYNNDGSVEESTYTHEDFIQHSHLSRFDKNMDGLSAAEFIGVGFQKLDDDDNNLIGLDEWKEAYEASLHDPTDEPERYN